MFNHYPDVLLTAMRKLIHQSRCFSVWLSHFQCRIVSCSTNSQYLCTNEACVASTTVHHGAAPLLLSRTQFDQRLVDANHRLQHNKQLLHCL